MGKTPSRKKSRKGLLFYLLLMEKVGIRLSGHYQSDSQGQFTVLKKLGTNPIVPKKKNQKEDKY